ncbi:MAG: metallophosphoesterase [Candidatus Liberibacter ctenarytainae]|uniref:Metallophosphoesterase n=1 Tax=Candidatus Liberibacter ctenarytainae TaxID=2020335 RepID=A0A937AJM3_9HYPH|nr:metallophosphoesterase [Candidatus Liberibacter ctenarytainae]
MFVLAHISDLHLSYPSSFSELSFKRLVGLANWHLNRKKYFSHKVLDLLINDILSRDVDHLSITGDIVNLANKREISAATHWLKSIGKSIDISIVLGNHDTYVCGSKTKSTHAWRDYIIGDSSAIGKPVFPYLRVRKNIAFIGCCTAIATPLFSANGCFGEKQAYETAKLLRQASKDGLFRVIMLHHPPIANITSIYNRMFGIKRFQDMILHEGAELILHGHTHTNSLHWIQGMKKLTPVVGIASASQTINTKKPQASYNLFYIEKPYNDWELRAERYTLSPDSNHIQKECTNIFL